MATSHSPSHLVIFDMEPQLTCGTTFVQADPSNFRALVQKLTGASADSSNHKLPVTYWTCESVGTQPFKLQETRQSGKKLEIDLQNVPGVEHRFLGAHGMMMTSVRTAMSREELEERGIAEKGYYMHPTPPGCRGSDPPQLLPLFPLHHSPCTSPHP